MIRTVTSLGLFLGFALSCSNPHKIKRSVGEQEIEEEASDVDAPNPYVPTIVGEEVTVAGASLECSSTIDDQQSVKTICEIFENGERAAFVSKGVSIEYEEPVVTGTTIAPNNLICVAGDNNLSFTCTYFVTGTDDVFFEARISKGSDSRTLTKSFDDIRSETMPSGLYVLDRTLEKIYKSDLDGSNQTVLYNMATPSDIALHKGQNILYFTDPIGKSILSLPVAGGAFSEVISGLNDPQFIAVDETNNRIYWSDKSGGKIKRCDTDGSNLTNIVTGLTSPEGIALDVADNKLYWALAGSIGRSNLDGSSANSTFINGVSPKGPITVNAASDLIYWTEDAGTTPEDAEVWSANSSTGFGAANIKVASDTGNTDGLYGTEIEVDSVTGDFVVILEQNENDNLLGSRDTIYYRMNSTASSVIGPLKVVNGEAKWGRNIIAITLDSTNSLIYHIEADPIRLGYTISVTEYDGSSRTALTSGYKFHDLTIGGNRFYLSRYVSDGSSEDYNYLDKANPDLYAGLTSLSAKTGTINSGSSVGEIEALYFDKYRNRLYDYLDGYDYDLTAEENFIEAGNMYNVDQYMYESYSGTIKQISTDYINSRLFYVDGSNVIRSNLDGSSAATFDTRDANGVTVDAAAGYVFYTIDAGATGEIYRSTLDGATQTAIVTARNQAIGTIHVDTVSGKIYWYENTGTKKIYSANYDGSSITEVLSGTAADRFEIVP